VADVLDDLVLTDNAEGFEALGVTIETH